MLREGLAALNNYPADCGVGFYVQAINDSLTCAADTTGGTPTFATITSGINTNQALQVGNLSTLSPTGTGTITANALSAGTYSININGNAATSTTATTAGNVTGIVALANGGTGADLSATGGANQFVRQSSAGGTFTVSAIVDGDIPDTITALTTSH